MVADSSSDPLEGDRPFDRCYQRGCRKAPTEVVSVTFPNGEGNPFALSYCDEHGRYAAELVRAASVVELTITRMELA